MTLPVVHQLTAPEQLRLSRIRTEELERDENILPFESGK
jgi:hypothetical protein